jgi:glycosyltransferase involved in cell wall biosynthesis
VLEAPRLSPLHHFLTRFALGRADQITATGLRLAQAATRYAPKGKPVTVVPYGVDLEVFKPRPRLPGEEGVVIGAVARLSPEKGLRYLVDAFARIARNDQRVRLVLAGDGPDRRRLERMVERERLDERVRFLGEVPHERVPEVLAGIDVFAMPSTAEGFGVAALEAAAMEVPVVATNVHGIPDVVADGETGLLVRPRDAGALAGALGRLVEDEALRRRLGQAGRAFVQAHYSWAENAAQMEELYRAALGGALRNQGSAC